MARHARIGALDRPGHPCRGHDHRLTPVVPWIRAYVAVIDDGQGMTPATLGGHASWGLGAHQTRSVRDLGRFGLGLKTASLSQVRRSATSSPLKDDTRSRQPRLCLAALTASRQNLNLGAGHQALPHETLRQGVSWAVTSRAAEEATSCFH